VKTLRSIRQWFRVNVGTMLGCLTVVVWALFPTVAIYVICWTLLA